MFKNHQRIFFNPNQ